MKTLTQLSQELHISKSSLNTRMKKIKNFKSRFCLRFSNQLFIRDDGIKLISYQKHNSTSKSFHTKQGSNKHQLTKKDLAVTIHQLLELNNNLKSENTRLKKSNSHKFISGSKKFRRALPSKDSLYNFKRDNQIISSLKKRIEKYKSMSFTDWLKMKFR